VKYGAIPAGSRSSGLRAASAGHSTLPVTVRAGTIQWSPVR
jgi:hypothetical protein